MRTEDGCIIQECLNGESEAFGILVDKYKAGIYVFVYSKIRDFHDAQDVTQEVFLQAYSIGGAIAAGSNVPTVEEYTPEGWLFEQDRPVSPHGSLPKRWGEIKSDPTHTILMHQLPSCVSESFYAASPPGKPLYEYVASHEYRAPASLRSPIHRSSRKSSAAHLSRMQ